MFLFFIFALLGMIWGLVLTTNSSSEDFSHLESFLYEEDFEQGELNAWASYPPNQDTAYDPYVYPGQIRPDEPGKCLVIKAEPQWNQDQLLGAVKLFDFLLDPSFSLRFRYYLKTVNTCPEISIHLPLADGQRLVYRKHDLVSNKWAELTLTWEDLKAAGLISGAGNVRRLTALAITARIAKADPDMPIYLGLDDIKIYGKREKKFQFLEPRVHELTEWKERIPVRHYRQGEKFRLRGSLDFPADKVFLAISYFSDRNNIFFSAPLRRDPQGSWRTAEIPLTANRFPPGLYLGTITAERKNTVLSQTLFTLFIESAGPKPPHPRFFVVDGKTEQFRHRLLSSRFRPVLERFLSRAKSYREKLSLDTVIFDLDQFPEKDWVASLPAWYVDRFMTFREALFTNAVSHLSGQDKEAAFFAKDLLLRLSSWPSWNHPWMEARGFHTYYPLGEFAEAFALAYDAVYELLTEEERTIVRKGLLRNYIEPAYQTYVVDNQVTSNSSNWISHIAGGALVALSTMAGDDPASLGDLEPWLTGFLLKEHRYITTVFGADGSYGEGFRYFNFAMQSFAKAIPFIRQTFGIDLTAPFRGSHLETIWTSQVEKNIAFGFGDTESYLKQEATAWWIGSENGPMNNWAWLLELTRDPTLAWLYTSLKEFDTLQEVLHETADIPAQEPASLGNVRFFPEVGTAVFRSGWKENDFVFVFRSGPFYNHQHMDQGSFYLADHGEIFLEERYDGEHHYYDDPVYRSHAIQPISHNTILLNRNPQSQKVGDPKNFAPGLNDQAQLLHWLDGENFAFVAGRLEKVYMENVQELKRNFLYFKPRTILLIDEVVPDLSDIEVNRLFHTRWKKDIAAGKNVSKVSKGNKTLFFFHLLPEDAIHEVLSEPHFLCQFSVRPLVERGYLQVSAKTKGKKLIFADLLSATENGAPPAVKITRHPGSITISAGKGKEEKTAVLNLETEIALGPWSSDALLLASSSAREVLVAGAKCLYRSGKKYLESEEPFYGIVRGTEKAIALRLNNEKKTELCLALPFRPSHFLHNGKPDRNFRYDPVGQLLYLSLPAGPNEVEILTTLPPAEEREF